MHDSSKRTMAVCGDCRFDKCHISTTMTSIKPTVGEPSDPFIFGKLTVFPKAKAFLQLFRGVISPENALRSHYHFIIPHLMGHSVMEAPLSLHRCNDSLSLHSLQTDFKNY